MTICATISNVSLVMRNRPGPSGITVIEILVIASILGALVLVAVPYYLNCRRQTQANDLAGSLRRYAATFEEELARTGKWPVEMPAGTVPPGMESRLPLFASTSCIGGQWDWDSGYAGMQAAVSLVNANDRGEIFARIDAMLDDGDPATGRILWHAHGLTMVLER